MWLGFVYLPFAFGGAACGIMFARREHGKMAGDMKRFSILGDSISTFEGCNPEGFDVFYENERRDATGVRFMEDTWWAQVIEQRGGKLLSNGSFSGSMVEGAGFPAANSPERIATLAKDGTAPDEILVFIGINDYGWGGPAAQAAGRGNALPAVLDLSAIPEAEAGLAPADAAERFGQAYGAMLARMRAAYPQAKVWCCTLCPGRIEGVAHSTFAYRLRGVHLDRYNDAIRLAAESNGCCVADVRALGRDYEALEGTHPTKRGMTQFALMVLHAMAACDGGSVEDCASNSLVDDVFGGAPRSLETCEKPSCIGCAHAGATGNKWLCVCRKDDDARGE